MESSDQLNKNPNLKSSRQIETHVDCSVIVPLYNEAPAVNELYSRLSKTMCETCSNYELVFVDDGSTDDTLKLIKDITSKDNKVTGVELRRNFGQTPALAAGFDVARGQIIVSMDGDLENFPEEIPNFIEKINDGYDVVSGWRKHRAHGFIMRRLPSMTANWIASKVSSVYLHDFGNTFKAYKREVIEELNLYGEMHRFIPALLSRSGIKIIEIPVKHINRPHGTSNYGISRTIRVVFDLITLRFLLGYITRPLHFFGRPAICLILASLALFTYILYDKFFYNVPISVAHAPLTALAMILLMLGALLVATGLLGEMISRVYFESTNKKIYSVRKIHRKKSSTAD